MTTPTWVHALAVLAGTGVGCGVATAAEQGAIWLLRRSERALRPLLAEPESPAPMVRYERTLWTPGAAELRWVRAGLGLAGLGLWLGFAHHPLAYSVALLAWLGALWLDLRASQTVEANAWQVAWQRSARSPAHRLPLVQVAAVHVVQRPAAGGWAALAGRLGLRIGTAYLALEFHSGRAIKLPRTDLQFGLAQVRRVAAFIEARQRQAWHDRRLALLTELRARRSVARLLPDAEQLALRRELAGLRRPRRARLDAPPRLLLEYRGDDPAHDA